MKELIKFLNALSPSVEVCFSVQRLCTTSLGVENIESDLEIKMEYMGNKVVRVIPMFVLEKANDIDELLLTEIIHMLEILGNIR